MPQPSLFDDLELPSSLPEGLLYEPGFLSPAEQVELLRLVSALPFRAAKYKGYTARRRVVHYGNQYDYDAGHLVTAEPLIDFLHPWRERVAIWLGVPSSELAHVLVSEYAPGTPLGWHRDAPQFEQIAGVSLGGAAELRFRPYPPRDLQRADVRKLEVEPGSIYRLRGPARWAWQHSVSGVIQTRWSITFRTPRHAANRGQERS